MRVEGCDESISSIKSGTISAKIIPRVVIGKRTFTLYDLVMFILFEATSKDHTSQEAVEFREIIAEKLHAIRKEDVYKGLQNSFERKLSDIYGNEPEGEQMAVQGKAKVAQKDDQKKEGESASVKPAKSAGQRRSHRRRGSAGAAPEPGAGEGREEKEASDERGKKRKRGTTEYARPRKAKKTMKRSIPDVRRVHLFGTACHVRLDGASWFWNYDESSKDLCWPHNISMEAVNKRLHVNLSKLSFSMIAVKYARSRNKTIGHDLFDILASPCLFTEQTEKDEWTRLLAIHNKGIMNLAQEGGIWKEPEMEPTQGQSFCEYFSSIVGGDKTEGASTTTTAIAQEEANVAEVGAYWLRKDFDEIATCNINVVEAALHHWKCCVVFDTICHNYFDGRDETDLTAAVMNHGGSKNVYPSNSITAKREWESDFNMVVYSLKELKIQKQTDLLFGPPKRRTVFLDALITHTSTLREEAAAHEMFLPEETAAVKSTVSGPRVPLQEVGIEDQVMMKQLKGLFFRPGGYLRYDVQHSMDFGPKHGFIRFAGHNTKDERWFMPLITIDPRDQGKSYNVERQQCSQQSWTK